MFFNALSEGHKDPPKTSIEATEKEASQAKTLQGYQADVVKRSLIELAAIHEAQCIQRAGPAANEDTMANTNSVRERLVATGAKARSVSDDGDDDDEETSALQDEQLEDGPSSLTTSDEGETTESDAVDDEEEAAGNLAVERQAQRAAAALQDEEKLLVGQKEAKQAQEGLKTCSQGSFLKCRQVNRGKRQHQKARTRAVS